MPANFGILMEQHFQILVHRWVRAVLEILFMAIMFAIIVWNPAVIRPDYNIDDIRTNKWEIIEPVASHSAINDQFKHIQYVKVNNTPALDQIMTEVGIALGLNVTAVSSEKLMESKFESDTTLCGVVFDNTENFPEQLNVRLRFPNRLRSVENTVHKQDQFWQFRVVGDINAKEAKDKKLSTGIYYRERFSSLQHVIFEKWLSQLQPTPTVQLPKFEIGWFSFPKEYRKIKFLDTSGLVPFMYNFAFCFSFCNTVHLYARTCQKNMLPHKWRYGYRYSTNWWALSVNTVLKLMIMDLVMLFCIYLTSQADPYTISFRDVGFGYLSLFLFLYNLQFIVCAIFYAMLMRHGRRSVLLTLAIWLATYGSFTTLLQGNYNIQNPVIIILLIAHFNNAFPLGMAYMYNRGSDITNDYWIITGCMAVNIVLYTFLVSWLQYLSPGRYMQVYKFDFLYLKSLLSNQSIFGKKNIEYESLTKSRSWDNFEYGPLGTEGFVKLKNICTTYKLFVDSHHLKDISMTLFKGEITILYGHHSSGKTSLICLMAGWQVPHSGTIKYNNLDLHKDWEKARKLCDVSMPNNNLSDFLTVRNTLVQYVRVKQEVEDMAYVRAEVRKWLDVLKPVIPNQNNMVKDLTYDQKRLLCLCVVLSCDTKIILLDEPTQYMRIQEKHIYWNILRQEKADRVILYATYSLDEANYIGDRIAILENGKLLAYGTPFFLKTTFCDAYYLVINKSPFALIKTITEFVRKYIPDITMEHAVVERVVYKVPVVKRPQFQYLLLNLEKHSDDLGIYKIRMLTCTLNEVVMMLTKDKVKPLLNKPPGKI